jgi:hypothetical protein
MLKIMMGCMLVPRIPKTGLGLHGPPGSAKSLLTKAIKRIIDPSIITNQKIPGKEDELERVLSKHHICTFDNVRNMTKGQADILCNAITGGATSRRTLYTNDDDFAREIKTTVIVNGVNLEITEEDLLDRFYTLEMNIIPKELRRSEGEILAEIEGLIPGVLSELFGHLSKAMRVKGRIEVKDKPRMADWYEWAICFAEVMGIGRGRFEKMFTASQARQDEYALENNIVGTVIVDFVDTFTTTPYFAGTPTEIMEKLTKHAEGMGIKTNVRGWPKDAGELTKAWKPLQKPLNSKGIWIFDFKYRELKGRGIIGEYNQHYIPDARIRIITKDPEPFKAIKSPNMSQNTRLDDTQRWGEDGQAQNQNRKTGQTGNSA